MASQWTSSVRQTHQLKYYLNSITGLWLTAIRDAISEFNTLSATHNLGVTYTQSTTAPSDSGGADISISTGNGSMSFSYSGTHTTTVNGRALQGSTLLISRQGGPVEKAFMFLPNQPVINTPSGQRPTGQGVMKVIALHELIHGCGLHNADHTADDVFNGFPSTNPGRTAAQDRIQITVGGQYRSMPPIIFSGTTAIKISRLWND